MTSPGSPGSPGAADEDPPSADPASRPRRRIEPPAGQPISSGFTDPLTDEQRRDISRRLAELFPFAEPGDFWAKEVRPYAPGLVPGLGAGAGAENTSMSLPSAQPEDR